MFIEVTMNSDGSKRLLNISHIMDISDATSYTVIIMSDTTALNVTETYADIKDYPFVGILN